MKVLVVQLARFGDIVQTIPVANALKRNPEMELHFCAAKGFLTLQIYVQLSINFMS